MSKYYQVTAMQHGTTNRQVWLELDEDGNRVRLCMRYLLKDGKLSIDHSVDGFSDSWLRPLPAKLMMEFYIVLFEMDLPEGTSYRGEKYYV